MISEKNGKQKTMYSLYGFFNNKQIRLFWFDDARKCFAGGLHRRLQSPTRSSPSLPQTTSHSSRLEGKKKKKNDKQQAVPQRRRYGRSKCKKGRWCAMYERGMREAKEGVVRGEEGGAGSKSRTRRLGERKGRKGRKRRSTKFGVSRKIKAFAAWHACKTDEKERGAV